MAATSLSAVIVLSSNSTRARAFCRLTSALFTPGSLSKAVATETGQALHTIPFTSIIATFGAAFATDSQASSPSTDSAESAATIGILELRIVSFLRPYMPART